MLDEKRQVATLGLVFAVGAAVGLLASNKSVREQFSEKLLQLLSRQ